MVVWAMARGAGRRPAPHSQRKAGFPTEQQYRANVASVTRKSICQVSTKHQYILDATMPVSRHEYNV